MREVRLLHEVIDARIHRALPRRPIGRTLGQVTALVPSVRKAWVRRSGATTPVLVPYLGLPFELVVGDVVALEEGPPGDGWLVITAVVDRDAPAETVLRAPVLLSTFTPAQITATTHDWNPTGGTDAYQWRISSDTTRSITGIVAGRDTEERLLVNVGAYTITLEHADAGSAAVNRFLGAGAADVAIATMGRVRIVYDELAQRWRAFG